MYDHGHKHGEELVLVWQGSISPETENRISNVHCIIYLFNNIIISLKQKITRKLLQERNYYMNKIILRTKLLQEQNYYMNKNYKIITRTKLLHD